MKVPVNNRGRLGRILLLVLLLAAQGLVLAHEIDHLGVPDTGDCVTCSVHSGGENAAATQQPSLYPEDTTSLTNEETKLPLITQRSYRLTARAPPIHL